MQTTKERESKSGKDREKAQCRELVGRDCVEMKCEVRRAEPARRFAKTDYRNTRRRRYLCVCVCKKRVESRPETARERARGRTLTVMNGAGNVHIIWN